MYAGVVLVDDRIEYGFAQGVFRDLQRLDALQPFIMDRRDQILGLQHLHDPVSHADEVAGDDVLKHQIGFVLAEPADAEVAQSKELCRVLSKTQNGGVFETTVIIQQIQILEHGSDVRRIGAFRHAVVADGVALKVIDCFRGDRIQSCAFLNDIVP